MVKRSKLFGLILTASLIGGSSLGSFSQKEVLRNEISPVVIRDYSEFDKNPFQERFPGEMNCDEYFFFDRDNDGKMDSLAVSFESLRDFSERYSITSVGDGHIYGRSCNIVEEGIVEKIYQKMKNK